MGETKAVVSEVAAANRRETVEGKAVVRGRTLRSWIDELGGLEGEVVQPTTGSKFKVSLASWADRDPSTTWLEIMFETDDQ